MRGGTVTGGSATGGSATGGSARGGDAVGGSAVGGSVSGGSVVGGSARGGSASATGSATGGVATSGSVSPGTATATVGGRTIHASADGGVSIQADGDRARVQLGTHVLLVESDRILVDGRERARLSPAAESLQISNSGGRLTVHSGGEELLSQNLGR